MRKSGMISAALLAAVFVGLFTGCSGKLLKDMGSFKPSIEATENFKKFVVRSDYNYFISGSDVYPVAIFGLQKDVVIDSDEDLWKKIEPKTEIMADLVTNMQRRLNECCLQSPHGLDILDNQGRKIGEWYSMLGLIIGIKIKEGGKVVIYPPSDTDEVKKYQDRTSGKAR
jgi:hypothetical protein